MRKFFNTLLIFSIPIVLTMIILIITTNLIVNKKANFKLNKKSERIIFGHSQTQCAFNDALISNFKNLSQGGESYFYTYQKIKKVLQQNPQINTVFIDFSNDNISKLNNKKIWSDKYLNWKYQKFSPFIDSEDLSLLMSKNLMGLLKTLPKSTKYNMTTILKMDYNYIDKMGGYKYLVRFKTDSILNAIDKVSNNGYIVPEYQKMSAYNLYYLEKIIKVCKDNNIKVFLIRSPYHPKSQIIQNELNLQMLKELKLDHLEFLDFKDFPIENLEFGDLIHLNYKGAKKFSTWFNVMLEKGLLESLNKKQIIENEICKLKNE